MYPEFNGTETPPEIVEKVKSIQGDPKNRDQGF